MAVAALVVSIVALLISLVSAPKGLHDGLEALLQLKLMKHYYLDSRKRGESVRIALLHGAAKKRIGA